MRPGKKMKISSLNKEIQECEKCGLYKTRINVLTGEGNLNARLMLIAQAPGENEDKQGRMFIGPSGKVLDELLENDSNQKKRNLYDQPDKMYTSQKQKTKTG